MLGKVVKMESYNIYLGNTRVRIETDPACIDFENWHGETAFDSIEKDVSSLLAGSYICSVSRCSDVEALVRETLPFLGGRDASALFCGMYRDVYYTANSSYGLFARTDLHDKAIWVDVKEHLISDKSMYLIRSIIREHAIRLLFAAGQVPVHAAAVLDDKGRCVLISGDGGTGKSSATWHFLQQGYRLMSDDVSVWLPSGGRIAGCGGALYVRPDFVDRYPVSEYTEVSRGRKYRIPVADGMMALSAPVGLVLMQPYTEGMASFWELARDDASAQLLQIHKNWCRTPAERLMLAQAAKALTERIPYVGALGLGARFETAVADMAERIQKNAAVLR